MAKKRYSHKQLKKDIKKDELRDLLTRITQFSRSNTENLLITAIIIGVIIILVPLYFKHQKDNEQRATNMMNQAVGYSIQQVSKGAAFGGQSFSNVEEKYKRVQQSFAEIAGNYRNSDAAKQAKLGEANAWFYLREYAKAKGLYEEALMNDQENPLKLTISHRIALCLESEQKWQEAIDRYQGMLTENPNYFDRYSVKLAMARCLVELNQTEKARKLIKEQAGQKESTYWAEMARRQLKMLDSSSNQK